MSWTQTYTGKAFDLANPDPATVDLEDVSHSLSQICRYTGHTDRHYSVAEHCVLIAGYLLPLYGKEVALRGLLHDASEAYVGDISRPTQIALGPAARMALADLHDRVTQAIYKGLGVDDAIQLLDPRVCRADVRILLTERAALMRDPPKDWGIDEEPLEVEVQGWPSHLAKLRYEETFKCLTR